MVDADSYHASKVAENQISVGGPIEPVDILSRGKKCVHRGGLATRGWKDVQVLRGLGLDGGQNFSIGRQTQRCITVGIPGDLLELFCPLRNKSDLGSLIIFRSLPRIQRQDSSPVW